MTGNDAFKAPSDLDKSKSSIGAIVNAALVIPWKINALDPAILFTTIYTALVYAIFYSFFEVFPLVYLDIYHMSLPHMGLVFLTAIVAALTIMPFYFIVTHFAISKPILSGTFPPPERRLIPALLGSLLVPTGMFLFAWTSSPHITWVPQVIAGVPIGFGLIIIFLQGINYIVDVYLIYANSALAANTFIRSLLGAAFPMFASQMYHNLRVAWASSVLAFITLAMIPVPILFYVYGARIRAMSLFIPKV